MVIPYEKAGNNGKGKNLHLMNGIEKKIESLRDYFAKRDDVLMAFVFGSYASGKETPESDFDVAIYLKQEKKETDKIWLEVTDIVQKEVDLVCLNDAPASLISNVIKTGKFLAIKDQKLYLDTYLRASLEAEDFLGFAEDFWEIYKRAKSLLPEQKVRLLERLQFLENELKEIEEFRQLTFKQYQDDKTKRRNIERWAENIINASIDTAKIILASEKKTMPKSYEEALCNFGIFAGLTEKNSKKLSKSANLRNILAHEYLDILYEKIQDFIREFPPLHKKIAAFLERYLSKPDSK